MIFYDFKKLKMFWNERGKCPKISDAVCFSPRLPISQIGQNEKLLSLISICVAASGEQSQHKKDNIYHNYYIAIFYNFSFRLADMQTYNHFFVHEHIYKKIVLRISSSELHNTKWVCPLIAHKIQMKALSFRVYKQKLINF